MCEYKQVTVEGLHGIKATTLLDSISSSGERLTTFVGEYPRIILAGLVNAFREYQDQKQEA